MRKLASALPLCLLLAVACGRAGGATVRPFKVALHVHGSFSEGTAAMRMQATRAGESGYDALWWTDHDWRLARHTHLGRVDFTTIDDPKDCVRVAPRGAAWSPDRRCIDRRWSEDPGRSNGSGVVGTDVADCAGLAIQVAAAPTGSRRVVDLDAEGGRLKAALAAEPTLVVSGSFSGSEASGWLEILLSEHPLPESGGAFRPKLRYRLGGESPTTENGVIERVSDLAPGGGRIELDLARELARGNVPGGLDHSLAGVSFVVEGAPSGHGRLCLESLELTTAATPRQALERRAGIAADLESELGVRQHSGLELSYSHHLVALLPSGHELPDFERHPHGMEGVEAVRWIHRQGGVAVYAHPFGAGQDLTPSRADRLKQRWDLAVGSRIFGADLLEVGYRQRVLGLAEHLELWDRLLDAGQRVVAVGTNDSHDGGAGWTTGNDFATWVWAADTTDEELLRGLREGRAFFGPTAFRGAVDLLMAGRPVMGSVLSRQSGAVEIEARVAGASGATLRWVVDGRVRREVITGQGSSTADQRLRVESPRFVRLEVWRDGAPVVFSNPVFFGDESTAP